MCMSSCEPICVFACVYLAVCVRECVRVCARPSPSCSTVPYQILNGCAIDRLLVRQVGTGPMAAECASCWGGVEPRYLPFSLEKPSVASNKKRLMIQARPVGIPSLYYWLQGNIGRAVYHGRWGLASQLLVRGCLGEDEGAAGAGGGRDIGDGSTDGWGLWSEVDGVGEVAIDEVGSQTVISVGAAAKGLGAFRVAGSRKLFVDVVADATTGISKVR